MGFSATRFRHLPDHHHPPHLLNHIRTVEQRLVTRHHVVNQRFVANVRFLRKPVGILERHTHRREVNNRSGPFHLELQGNAFLRLAHWGRVFAYDDGWGLNFNSGYTDDVEYDIWHNSYGGIWQRGLRHGRSRGAGAGPMGPFGTGL